MVDALKILFGFAFLLVGAEYLVRGSVAVAKRWGISPLVIGMTVVAMGTSAPELVVSIGAALSGAPAMALGNVVGSNIANVLLILGAAGLVRPIRTEAQGLSPDGISLMGGSLVFLWLCLTGTIDFGGGILLLAAFALFLGASYWQESRAIAVGRVEESADVHVREVEELTNLPRTPWRMGLSIVAGIAGLWLGADLLVGGGTNLARALGVSDAVIGLTLIALGTSLPELAASVMAAWRGHTDVAFGNVVGSNLFNILGVTGATAVISPLPVPAQMIHFDLWVMLAVTVLVMPFLTNGWLLGRALSGALVAAYVAYIAAQHYGVDRLIGV